MAVSPSHEHVMSLKYPVKNTSFQKCIQKTKKKDKVFSVKCFGFGKIVDFHKDSVICCYITPELQT